MSYILDALKKAESEREHGAVPGLNTAQSNHSTYIHYRTGARPLGWMLLVLVLVLGLLLALVGLVWVWVWRQPVAEVARPVTALPEVATQLQPPVLPPQPQPQPQSPVPVPALAVAQPPASAPLAVSVVAHVVAKTASSAPSPVALQTPVLQASASVPAPALVAGPAPKAESKPAATAASSSRPTPAGLPLLQELPDSLRRQIPAMNISGAIVSDAPAEWTLIINDQIMGKGSQVAPELRLEDITATSAVFNFRGQRFRVER